MLQKNARSSLFQALILNVYLFILHTYHPSNV